MTLPISSTQLDLAARMVTDSVWLFVLTTYSDKAAGTVSETFYWTHTGSALSYDYGGSGDVQFLPVVVNKPGSTLGASVPRIADRSPSDRQALLVELENSPVQDASGNILHESIWETLIGENLHGADLVVSELLVNPHLRVNASTPWWDLRSLAGTDHTVRFRGECVQVEPVGATVPMRFAHVEPEVPFVTLLDQQNNHPEDFGSRMPVIVGQAKAVECKRIKVGTVTTLSAGLAIDATGDVSVTDASGLPGAPFSAWINGEEILCDAADATTNTVTINARGQNGTSATSHTVGSILVELVDEVILGVSGNVISQVDKLEILNPFTQEWTTIDIPYEVRAPDVESIPGETISTIRITQDNLRALLGAFFVSAQVTAQPEFTGDTGGAVGDLDTLTFVPTTVVRELNDPNIDGYGVVASPNYLQTSVNHVVHQYLTFALASGDLQSKGAKEIKRIRMHMEVDHNSAVGGARESRIYCQSIDSIPGLGSARIQTDVTLSPKTVESGWNPGGSIPAGTTISDLVGLRLKVWIRELLGSGEARVDLDEVSLIIEFYETSPTGAGTVGIERIADVEIQAGSVGFNTRFRCDAQGAVVPGTFTEVYDFGDDATWSDDGNLTHTGGGTDQEFAVDDTQAHAMDSLDNWIKRQSGDSISLDTTTQDEGSGCITIVSSANNGGLRNPDLSAATPAGPWDLDANVLVFRLRMLSSGAPNINTTTLYLGSSTSFSSNFQGFKLLDFAPDFEADDEWHTVSIHPSSATAFRNTPTYNEASTIAFQLTVNDPNLTSATASHTFSVDNIRLVPRTAKAQLNTVAGTNDLSGGTGIYEVTATIDNPVGLESVKIHFDDGTSTGTTLPAQYRTLTISGGQFTDGVAATVLASVFDTNDPTFADVETIQVELTMSGRDITPPTVTLDSILEADASNANYTLAPGTLIENPADVDRWFIADFCGLGHAAVGSTNSAFKTAHLILGILGGNLTGLGERFSDIRGAYLYEARASGYEIETAAGTVYQVRTASLAHAWGAVSQTFGKTDYEAITEQLPDVTELGNSFQAFWSYRPTIGFGEEAFAQVSVTNPNDSDAILAPGDSTAMAAARVRFGPRRFPPLFLYMIQDANAAADTLGFYAYVRSEEKFATYRLEGVPNWKSFALEPGDIVSIALRGSLRIVAKAEVLSCQRAPGSMVATLVCGGVE